MSEESQLCYWCDAEIPSGGGITEGDKILCSERCRVEYGDDLELEDLKRCVYGDVGY